MSGGTRTPVREWRPPAGAPVATHPKMRARRAEVARSVGRRRLRRIRALLAVVCAVVWGLVALRSPLLDVDRVHVIGAERTPVAEVRRVAGNGPGTPMAEADLADAGDDVAALPWVDEVRVTRLWPGTIRIVLTERREVAAVDAGEGWALLDAEGRVLARVEDEPDLPTLPGRHDLAPGARVGEEERRSLAILGALPGALRDATEEAAHGDDGLELVLDDGFRVVVGDGDDLARKAEAAEAVRQHAETEDGPCRIDVRVPTAPVLTPGSSCA